MVLYVSVVSDVVGVVSGVVVVDLLVFDFRCLTCSVLLGG